MAVSLSLIKATLRPTAGSRQVHLRESSASRAQILIQLITAIIRRGFPPVAPFSDRVFCFHRMVHGRSDDAPVGPLHTKTRSTPLLPLSRPAHPFVVEGRARGVARRRGVESPRQPTGGHTDRGSGRSDRADDSGGTFLSWDRTARPRRRAR